MVHPSGYSPDREDRIVRKSTPDAFHDTRLHEILSALAIGQLVIAGLQTEYCSIRLVEDH
jgi:aminoglycoside 6'-N-acetyltransferase